jgi:hypothetical protein
MIRKIYKSKMADSAGLECQALHMGAGAVADQPVLQAVDQASDNEAVKDHEKSPSVITVFPHL